PLDDVRLFPARPADFPDTLGFGFPVRFRVEISAEENFATKEILADYTGADFKHRGDEAFSVSVKGKPARFIRVTATRLWEINGDYLFALSEIQAIAGGTNSALAAKVSALDSFESGYWSKK